MSSIELINKPSILVYTTKQIKDGSFYNVLYGIEEEGIPFRVQIQKDQSNVVLMAHTAAGHSALSVGIACDGEKITVHYRNLPKDYPFFSMERYQAKPKEVLRALGANAARLVKGTSFKEVEEMGVKY